MARSREIKSLESMWVGMKPASRQRTVSKRTFLTPSTKGKTYSSKTITKPRMIIRQLIAKNVFKKSLSENEKIMVLIRQDMRCNSCAAKLIVHPATKRKLFDFDHIVPRRKCGETTFCNIQALCKQCHAIKTGWDMMK